MAAVVGSILTAAAPVLPSLLQLIVSLAHQQAPVVEANNGPGTGMVKFGDLFAFVIDKLNTAAIAGQIDKTLPPEPVIQMIIQAVVSSMQLSGVLGKSAAAPVTALSPVSADRVVNLQSGQSILIQVK